MKKNLIFLLTAFLLSSTACANPNIPQRQRPGDMMVPVTSQQQALPVQNGPDGDGFVLLGDANSSFSNHFGTEQGYYQFTESCQIADGLYGRYLTYIDYASKEEVYLCSDSACLHNSATCSSVFLDDEFGIDSMPFVWGNMLYVLGREYDDDGAVAFGTESAPEKVPAALYCMEPDGSDRRKLYTFPEDTVVEKLVLGSGDALWFVTKEPVFEQEGNKTYTLAKERRLCRYSITENKMSDGISLTFGDNMQYKVLGGHGSLLVLSGVAYPDGMSEMDVMRLDDADWREVWENSTTVYSTFDVITQEKKEIYRTDNSRLS